MKKAHRPHDVAVVELLREGPAFADEYQAVAMEEADQPGGHPCWQRCGMSRRRRVATVAERAGIPRESLYRALSPMGNLTIKTLLAVLGAAGLKLGVRRDAAAA